MSNSTAEPLERLAGAVQRELLLLEARQTRHVDVGPDEEMHVHVEWHPADAMVRDRLALALNGLTLSA
jgi:hypothetical protein